MDEIPREKESKAGGFIWEAPEYFHREKTRDWFWVFGAVAVTLIVLSMIFNDVLFGIFLIVSSLTLLMFANRPPRIIRVEIGSKGILIEKTLYHWSELESFWIREEDLHPKILIKSRKFFVPYIVVPIGDIDHEVVRDHLLQYLNESVHQEPLIQQLIEYFGF